MWSIEELDRALPRWFGYESFLPGQRVAIEALLAGQDVLCILPTGAGKSLIYQLAARCLHEEGRGVTLVVSPLIALMKDQADSLAELGWSGVGVLNSHVPAEVQEATLDRLRDGELVLLYVTPERLESPDFLERLVESPVALVAVDEAHCISQWGEDFRPAFLRVDEAVYALRESRESPVPLLALTATAPPAVREDIIGKLRLETPRVVAAGFERDNLHLEVEHVADESGKWAALDRRLGAAAELRLAAPGIVYCATVRATEPVAERLAEAGWRSAVYHGQMDRAERQRVQEAFMMGEVEIVVATNAFGMGIDKPDLRFVLHWDLPGSPEAYYQEAGRAGRDGLPSTCLLFYHPGDRHLQAFFASQGGARAAEVRSLWATLGGIYEAEPIPLATLARAMGRRSGEVERLLPPLEENGYLRRLDDGRLEVLDMTPPDALELEMRGVAERQSYDQSRLRMMEAYALTSDCRHEFLLNYLGQPYDTDDCGHCDNCHAGRSVLQSEMDLPFTPGERVQHPSWGAGTVQRLEGGQGVTILFERVGYKTIALAVWEENPTLLERLVIDS